MRIGWLRVRPFLTVVFLVNNIKEVSCFKLYTALDQYWLILITTTNMLINLFI